MADVILRVPPTRGTAPIVHLQDRDDEQEVRLELQGVDLALVGSLTDLAAMFLTAGAMLASALTENTQNTRHHPAQAVPSSFPICNKHGVGHINWSCEEYERRLQASTKAQCPKHGAIFYPGCEDCWHVAQQTVVGGA